MKKKIYIFDLDGVLCTNEKDVYSARPMRERITKINNLYDNGNIIFIDSARGTLTGKPHQEKTERQLKIWGVKYTKLRTGIKYYGDFYVDDRGMNDEDFFKLK